MHKTKVLAIGDGGVATGFARVMENIFGNLPEDFYEIHQLAVNYQGDPYDKVDYNLYPAKLGGDMFGFGRLESMVDSIKPDLIFILNDTWMLRDYLHRLRDYDDIPKVVYFPVDAHPLKKEWCEAIVENATPVAYTEFGREAILQHFPEADVKIIQHGVDTDVFYPMERELARSALQGIEQGSFIVLNCNRNQPRKRIDLTIKGFAKFAKGKPKSVKLYHHCFPPGTPITTPKGVEDIEEVKVGTEVFTHTGESHKVTDIQERDYSGPLYELNAVGMRSTKMTPEHPVLTVKTVGCDYSRTSATRCRPWCKAQYKTRKGGRVTRNCRNQYYKDYETSWAPARSLKVGDYVLMPKIKENINKSDEDVLQLARLCGYYTSEGSTNKYAVMFSTYILEEPYHVEIEESMFDLFDVNRNRYHQYTNETNTVKQQHFLNREAVKWFNDNCGKGAKNKRVPEFVMSGQFDVVVEFLKTLWGGDGHYNTDKGFFTYTTVSRTLAYQVQLLLTKIGVFSSIIKATANGEFNGWHVSVWGSSAQILATLFCVEYHKENTITRQKGAVCENYSWHRVTEINKVEYSGKVYNFTVKEDNSYLAGNIAVHNCGVEDMGWNVIDMCERYDIDNRLLLTSLQLSPSSYVTDERLNWIYNASDVGLNTSQGEGWGLCTHEHGACRRAQITPHSSAAKSLYTDEMVKFIPIDHYDTYPRTMTEGAVVSADGVAEALEYYYENPDIRKEHERRLYEYTTDDKFQWVNIARKWDQLFRSTL